MKWREKNQNSAIRFFFCLSLMVIVVIFVNFTFFCDVYIYIYIFFFNVFYCCILDEHFTFSEENFVFFYVNVLQYKFLQCRKKCSFNDFSSIIISFFYIHCFI